MTHLPAHTPKDDQGEGMSEIGEGWQPIETAPKDGTAVLLYDASYRNRSQVVAGWWRSDRRGDRWIIGGGGTVFPTHWMPLPSHPLLPSNEVTE